MNKTYGAFVSKSRKDISKGFRKHPVLTVEASSLAEAREILNKKIAELDAYDLPDGHWVDVREIEEK